MRPFAIIALVSSLVACTSPDFGEVEFELGPGGHPGGWDYNNNRWNPALERVSVGPVAPVGSGDPNTLDAASYKVFHLRPSDAVACAPRDPSITAVRVVGSANVGGTAYGPRVMIHRGAMVTPLAIGQSTIVAASLRTQAMAAGDAVPVELKIEYVNDFVRPGGWIKWPQYAVTLYRTGCQRTFLAVSIFGPAFVFPTASGAITSLNTLADAVVPYSGFYDSTDPSLMAKAAINLDTSLNFTGEAVSAGQACAGTAVPANHPAFLGAMVTGAAVVTYHPDDSARRPYMVFRTKKGQPFRAHASVMTGGSAQQLCLRDDQRPMASVGSVLNDKMAWPGLSITELDVIAVSGIVTIANEVVASSFSWADSGASERRKQAFLSGSTNPRRFQLSYQADLAISAVVIKSQRGAVAAWSAINPLLADRTALVVVAETLPPEQASQGVEYATDNQMLNPVPGDGTCSTGELAIGGPDCPFTPPPPPSPIDAGVADAPSADAPAGDAPASDAPMGPDAGMSDAPSTDAPIGPDAGTSDAPTGDAPMGLDAPMGPS